MSTPNDPLRLDRGDGASLAYHRHAGDPARAGFVWLGGFKSDMEGGKALALDAWARESGRAFLRFDYQGHGASTGDFEDGTIGLWTEDALAAFDALTAGPQVLVGSSMGGWIALLVALARPERVAGLLLIAPAPDFTERLMRPELGPEALAAIERDGVYYEPSPYSDEPTPITKRLLDEGRDHLLYDAPTIPVRCPTRIIQGLDDPDVPWRHALQLIERLESRDIEFVRVVGGDHRLSTDADIARLVRIAAALGETVDKAQENAADR